MRLHFTRTGQKARPAPKAFTLIEILLSVAIISSSLLVIAGILPVGLGTGREATNHSVVATMLEDISQRLRGAELKSGAVPFSPAYYDELGVFVPETLDPAQLSLRRIYRADVSVTDPKTAPANTSGLKSAVVKLSWPLNPETGEALGPKNPRSIVTFGVTTLAGKNWQVIDPDFVPKIEF